jgi:hypothetical protein
MGVNQPYAYETYNWGATPDNATTQNGYHRFPCSKCHNPHASRLPRLMITNCLDTRINTWENQYPATSTTDTNLSLENRGVRTSNYTSAQNCHRRRNSTFNKTWTGGPALDADGWNNVTPW